LYCYLINKHLNLLDIFYASCTDFVYKKLKKEEETVDKFFLKKTIYFLS